LLTNTTLINIAPASINSIKTILINTILIIIIASDIINNSINSAEININSYKLNKLNIRKLGFIKDREIIIRYKFKYFKKDNKEG
jgi:ATP/ADP translocase